MPKQREPSKQSERAKQHTARRVYGVTTPKSSSKNCEFTHERYSRMSSDALAFARQMHANRHVRAVMRDLANK